MRGKAGILGLGSTATPNTRLSSGARYKANERQHAALWGPIINVLQSGAGSCGSLILFVLIVLKVHFAGHQTSALHRTLAVRERVPVPAGVNRTTV